MKSLLSGIKNILLWSYPRGSWQYDVLCLCIIAAVFLIPGRYFGDRDRDQAGQAKQLTGFASESVETERIIEKAELQSFLLSHKRSELTGSLLEATVIYLQNQMQRDVKIVRWEEITLEGERTAYRVWYK